MARKHDTPSPTDPTQESEAMWLPVAPTDVGQEVVFAATDVDRVADPSSGSISVSDSSFIPKISRTDGAVFAVFERIVTAKDWVRRKLIEEENLGARLIWAPVLFGGGCAAYFSLPREPLFFAFPGLLVLLTILFALSKRNSSVQLFLGCAFLIAAGVTGAQLKTHFVATYMLSDTLVATLSGTVQKKETRADGRVRYTITLTKIHDNAGRSGDLLSVKTVRLTARKGGPNFRVGDEITGRARLGPPPGPAFPGAYDFSFYNWFDGIGGSGFFLGPPKAAVPQSTASPAFTTAMRIAQLRSNIVEVIRNTLPGPAGGVAAALIVGDRSGVDTETNEALRKSGLAHILAISGLHMALVAATVIFVLRVLLASIPSVALRHPVRKWASGIALVAASVYLVLSGANISTQRAYIMVAIMLIAVLLDRKALTMRNVALAAFVVLILSPQAVLSPGFQMSFAAVAALIATFEVTMAQRRKRNIRYQSGFMGGVKRFAIRDIGGLAITSLVAGLATGLYAAYHFYRVAPFGLLANLLAMPLVSLAVMPLALISTLLMPFGLEAFPLKLLAVTTNWVVSIASWVATLEPRGGTGVVPTSTLLFGTMALLLACLMRTKLKLLCLPFFFLAGVTYSQKSFPDILILENGRQVGVITGQGKLNLLRPNAEKFSTNIWRSAFGTEFIQGKKIKRGKAGDGFRCDDFGCSVKVKDTILVHVKNTGRMIDDCRIADILVVPYRMPEPCAFMEKADRPVIVDAAKLRKNGAHALSIIQNPGGRPPDKDPSLSEASQQKFVQTGLDNFESRASSLIIQTAYPDGARPWNRHRRAEN